MSSHRAHLAAIVLSTAICACGGAVEEPAGTDSDTVTTTGGKADEIGSEPTTYTGTCANDAPSVPYQPVPGATRAQPDGPDVVRSQIGVPFEVRYDRATPISGSFSSMDCGRHYFVFTLDRPARLRILGGAYSDNAPTSLELCFALPHFLRLDTSWYTDIWEKDASVASTAPCGTFVPVGDALEPADGRPMDLEPGAYELTIDSGAGQTEYTLDLEFDPIGSAVCGDGIRDAGEACDDGNQLPLDWCGSDCQPQRLDIEPIPGNESAATAQPLDGFRVVNFYAPPGGKEVDVYSLTLAARESVHLARGERTCSKTFVQLLDANGEAIAAPWDCNADQATAEFAAPADGEYFLRFETAPGGARSVSAHVLP